MRQLSEEQVRAIVRDELARAISDFLEVKEVARRLTVTTWTVYALLDQQAMESRYVGRRRIVPIESFNKYADSLPSHPAP